MKTYDTKEMNVKFCPWLEQKQCPECGDNMREMDRCNEDGVLFVWYECNRKNCSGQWLQKHFV